MKDLEKLKRMKNLFDEVAENLNEMMGLYKEMDNNEQELMDFLIEKNDLNIYNVRNKFEMVLDELIDDVGGVDD